MLNDLFEDGRNIPCTIEERRRWDWYSFANGFGWGLGAGIMTVASCLLIWGSK